MFLVRPGISYSSKIKNRILEKLSGTQSLQQDSSAKLSANAKRNVNKASPICGSMSLYFVLHSFWPE